MIAFLWAESHHGIIGKNHTLPWHLPADMHYFKTTTTGHTILAGHMTYESFGRPLPNRVNCVLTHLDQKQFPDSVHVYHTVEQFIQDYQRHPEEEVFVVGGAKIFAQFLPFVDRLYQTVIDAEIDGDTVMPKIDYQQFELIKNDEHQADDRNPYDYAFKIYQRRSIG